MRRVGGICAAVVAAATMVAACGADRDDSVQPTVAQQSTTIVTVAQSSDTFPANGATELVDALDNNYRPQVLTIKAGTTVEFTNVGRNVHNVVPADDKTASTWGVLEANFAPKATYRYVFASPGTYHYYCTIHGTPTAAMFGTIVVTAP